MPEPNHYQANLQRGSLLLDQARPREALPFIQAAIAANPDAAAGYAELARCWNEIPAERSKSIAAIDRAIGLAPNSSFYFGRKGWYLVCLLRYQAALAAAQNGLAINPTCAQSLNALANAHTKLGQWKKAEEACLRILAQNPNDAPGLNLLAQALRHLGRWQESREVVARLLANMPNNSFGHANAGYAALAAGDHHRANEHFLESLRMNPHFDLARRGLLQSLRARIWLLRFGNRPASDMSLSEKLLALTVAVLVVVMIAVGLYALMQWASTQHADFGDEVCTSLFIALVFFPFLYTITYRLCDLLLMFDQYGRHVLSESEKARAVFVGVIYGLGILVFAGLCQWIVVLAMVTLLGVLAISINFSLIKDRLQRRNAE